MKKRINILVVCLIAFLGLLAGCSQEQEASGSASTAEKKDLKFVIVPKVVHPWFDEVNKGAQEQAKLLEEQLGVKVTVEYIAPTAADVTEQNSILEKAAATRPDGIAVDPLDPVGNQQVIDEIRDRGIEVVVFDSTAPEGSGITEIGNDFYEQGVVAAERLAEILDFKGEVAIMQGFPTAPNHQARYQAQVDTLKQYPDIKVIDGGISNDDIQTAQQQAAAILASNPNLSGYLMSDASGPIGIPAAIKEAGKEGKVLAVGMDSLKPIAEEVKGGTLDSSSASVPKMQGSMSILMLWQASLGVDIPQTIDTGIEMVTKENADKFITEE